MDNFYNNFKMQKCQHLEDALALKTPKIHGDYIIKEKLEGWYSTIYYDGFDFHAPRASSNSEKPAWEWVVDSLNSVDFSCNKPFFMVAEAYLPDTPFEILNGLFNRSTGNYICKDALFMVHDVVPLQIAMTATDREIFAQQVINALNLAYLQYIPPLYIGGYVPALWEKYRDIILDKGGEGIVMKRAGSFYQYGKRNADLLKDKLSVTIDTVAMELVEGIGEKGNASLTLISKRANGMLIRTVINKHSDQEFFRTNASRVLGNLVVELGAMSEYPDGQLRQPVFRHCRFDKSPEDIN